MPGFIDVGAGVVGGGAAWFVIGGPHRVEVTVVEGVHTGLMDEPLVILHTGQQVPGPSRARYGKA